jgi:hypothetical protein
MQSGQQHCVAGFVSTSLSALILHLPNFSALIQTELSPFLLVATEHTNTRSEIRCESLNSQNMLLLHHAAGKLLENGK